jgi:predicted metal-dependent peptidase
MKFVTSRILSPSQTRSLKQIIEDAAKAERGEEQVVKTASHSSDNLEKVASEEVEEVVEVVVAKSDEKEEELEAEADSDESEDDLEAEAEADDEADNLEAEADGEESDDDLEAEASASTETKTASFNKGLPSFTFKNLSKSASLTKMDESYLKKYFGVYYPADYVDALLAQY